MGTDNLHHKRKQRTRDSFKRKISKRDQHEVILIVCEGKKTEPNYLKYYCDHIRLNKANITIIGLGRDPISVAEHAITEFNKNKDYNRVYCVFDKDQHQSYSEAVNKIKCIRNRKRNPINISAITSVPCFEYWLLLHFTNSTSPYVKNGNKSAGEQLLAELKTYIHNYSKGSEDIFDKTKDKLQLAITRAKSVIKQQTGSSSDNPSTNFFELIEYLSSLKR